MSAKSAIQVCIKVRPCEPGQTTLWQVKDRRAIQLIDSQADPCVFDYVFDQASNNQMVFDCMAKHIVEACIKGFNGTIFAYGQTSSGKTYTMMGDESNPGVMVLAAKEIFKQIARNSDRDFLLRVGYIEIYNEKIYDLLNKKNQDLKIHESNGMVHVNCEECIITSEEDLLQFLCVGNKERTVGETNMNERSSRSHAIFRIIIESRKTDRNDDDAVIQSLLNLVDLAGSERADQTGARGARLKEGGHINKSLHFLSNVIKSLAENEDNKYVSFRDSKLTRILQASLGGNAFTSIICSIKPSIMEESQSTLNFAMRAKKIRVKPQMNEIVSDATMMKRLEREIKELKDRLAEEQRKNESQIKVKLLERRIKNDTLKIITSNTIADKRNKDRRRTWGPATSSADAVSGEELHASNGANDPNAANAAQKFSGLPKPSFYPSTNHLNRRPFNIPKTINIMKSLEVTEEEEFKPAAEFNFDEASDPMTASRILPISLTPRVAQTDAQGKEIERDLVELKTFINLEQNIDSEWEGLNEKFAKATAQVTELQSERQELMQRCESLQAEVESFTQSKQEADTRIERYEVQLKALKQTIEKLEMENRSTVDLEFQFESHKSKSKLRENELLTALSEKDSAIDNLQTTLNELSRDMLRNSKEEQMRSMCPEIETSCERICNKCGDLERLIEEYKQSAAKSEGTKSIDCECDQLRVEIANTRAQLESVQDAYKQMTTDVAEKSELCDRLSRDIISAEEARGLLQEKYDDLEVAQQRHDVIIKQMEAECTAIQEKYSKLQKEYEILESTTAATEEQRKKLQGENEILQLEIVILKESVETIQQQLMETTALDGNEAIVQQLKTRNEELMENLVQMEAKFGELQCEYDDLSNQLLESVQDGDSLRAQCATLQEELRQQMESKKEVNVQNDENFKMQELLSRIDELEREISQKNVIIDVTEGTINEMREQMTNLESALLEKSVIVNKVEDYQRQIESLEKQHVEMTMVCEELQEKVKENTINESMINSTQTLMGNDAVSEQEMEDLRAKLSELNIEVNVLHSQIQQKDELIERIQSELQELNERCISMDVQQVELQEDVRQKQQLLERQTVKLKDDVNIIDKLQESNAALLERSIKAEESAVALREQLKSKTEVESSKAQYEKNIADMQLSLENIRKEFDLKEKQNKDELNNIKLEYLQKIELSESGYRENMRKYNIEWEESKDRYETSLNKLQKQLSSNEERYAKLSEDSQKMLMSVKTENQIAIDQLVQEKHELESLYDESQKLVGQIQAKLSSKELEEKEDREGFVKSSNQKVKELHEKFEEQINEYEKLKREHQMAVDNLKQEKSLLQSAVDESQRQIDCITRDLQAEKVGCQQQTEKVKQLSHELDAALKAHAIEKAEFMENVDALNSKIGQLMEDLKVATSKMEEYEKLLLEHEESKTLLAKSNDLNMSLAQKSKSLERELILAQKEVNSQNVVVDKLQSELEELLLIKSSACSEQTSLQSKLQELEAVISDQANEFKHTLEEVQSAKIEQQLKIDSLLNQKQQLEAENEQLKVKLKNELNIQNLFEKEREQNSKIKDSNAQLHSVLEKEREKSSKLQDSNAQLQSQLRTQEISCGTLREALQQQKVLSVQLEERLVAAELESNNNADKLRSQVEVLQKEIDRLRSLLKANNANFSAERTRFDSTISSLLEDKRNLEEKLFTTDVILKKLEADQKSTGSNVSFDSNASNTSPVPRKSLDHQGAQPRKSFSLESEARRNKRISTYDERRRLSYWNDSQDVGCMTDPVDNNCNCAMLDQKLKECQRELFIMESRVTALNIELKNHPLKEETVALKKRLQDEQIKARDEVKRLKQKNLELISKLNAYIATAAISANTQGAAVAKIQQATAETQTESDVETALKKMTDKLNDSLQLCRHRYGKIKELEERLKQNENSDTSNISSQTAGQISALKSQLELQKKDIFTLTNKYEFAKRALKMRRDELDQLRQVAGTETDKTPK